MVADAQLLQYILQQERAGMTQERITQALRATGYTDAQITQAFKEMQSGQTDATVHEYVQGYVRQNTPAPKILELLVQQGYPAKTVKRAIIDVCGPGALPSSHSSTVIFALFALLVGAGGMYVLMGHTSVSLQPQPTQLDPQTFSPSEIIAGILETTRSSGKAQGVQACQERLQGKDRDLCLLDVAIIDEVRDVTLCDQIVDVEYHDACLLSFLNTNFESVCQKVKLASSQQTCSSIGAFSKENAAA